MMLVTAPAPVSPAARRAFAPTARRFLRVLLTVLVIGLLVRFAVWGWPEIRDSLSLLTRDRLPLLGWAVLAEVLWLLAMSQVYRSALLAFGGTLSRPGALRVSMAAFTLSRILPGGGAAGGAIAARELVSLGNPPLRTVASMLASWWITMSALSTLVSSGVAFSVARASLPPAQLVAPVIGFAVFFLGGAVLVGATRSRAARTRLSALLVRGAARLGPAAAASARLESLDDVASALRPRRLLVVLGWSMGMWALDAAALWLALAAFGWHADLGVLLLGYGVANLVAALPELTPGWLGVIETTVAGTLSAFGIPVGTAVVAVLVYRLVSYWLPTAAGIPAAIAVVGHRRPRPAAPVQPARRTRS